MQLRVGATLSGHAGVATEIRAGRCYWCGELAGETLSGLLRSCAGGELRFVAGSVRRRVRAERCWYDVRQGTLLVRLALGPTAESGSEAPSPPAGSAC